MESLPAQEPQTAPRDGAMGRFFLLFVLISSSLLLLELTVPAQKLVVEPWTALLAKVSAALVTLFDADAYATGNVLLSNRANFGVSILPGCNGVEAMVVLFAGVVAYPAPWRARLRGFLLGTAVVQLLNVLRVITLFYVGQWDLNLFQVLHLHLWPVLIMLDVFLVWLWWTWRLEQGRARNP